MRILPESQSVFVPVVAVEAIQKLLAGICRDEGVPVQQAVVGMPVSPPGSEAGCWRFDIKSKSIFDRLVELDRQFRSSQR